jgi:hypothetical protein
MAELMIRYGWERGWERILPRPGELDVRGRVLGYEHPDIREYIPPREVLAQPTWETEDPWAPSMSGFARAGYAPAYAPTLLPMDARVIVLTRGDHALVAATFRLPADTTMRSRAGLRGEHLAPPAFRVWPVRAGFVLAESGDAPLHALTTDDRTQGVISMDVPSGDYLASIEVLDPRAGLAGRFRNGLRVSDYPPDVPVLSDLLLVEGPGLPRNTREALSRLRIDDEVTMGEPLSVGWEIWGLGWREEMIRFRLTLEPARRGLLGRIRNLFGGQGGLPILDWEEPGPDAPGADFQAVSLTLPQLDEGEYVLRLRVDLAGREPMESRLRFKVMEPEDAPERGLP